MKSKKIIGLTLVGMTLISSMVPVFAEYNPDKVVDGPIATLSITQMPQEKLQVMPYEKLQQMPQDSFGGLHLNMVVNGKGLNPQDTKVYMKDNGVTMIPLRLVSEALGYEVKWNGEKRAIELVKGAQWTSIKIGEDRYFFARVAPFPLGAAPEVKDGRTYVPLKFVTDILKLEVMRDETGTIHINNKDVVEKIGVLSTVGKIVDVQKIKENTRILVEGMKNSEGAYDTIIFNINEHTKIENPLDHAQIAIEDLKAGDDIRVSYGPALTRSLPPIGNAEKIEVLKDIAVKEGEITDIQIDDKYSRVLVGSMTEGVMLIINEDTKIVTENNKVLHLKDLEKGMSIIGYHDLIMTMSIPGMTTAKKIVVK